MKFQSPMIELVDSIRRASMIARRMQYAVFFAALTGLLSAANGPVAAGTIDQIRANQTIRLAYREDAPPFSYKEANSTEPAGYIVDICRAVAKKLSDQMGVSSLKISYVPVTSANRFDIIKSGQADLLCEPTSATLSRRAQVDFSIPTFIDGASLLVTDSSIRDLKSLAGKKIGVLASTTTESAVQAMLKAAATTAEVVPAKTHAEGIAALDDGKVSAYFGDRSILLFLLKDSKSPEKLKFADTYLTIEPYALALRRGDDDFRLAIDTALSHIYLSGDISKIFAQTFGDKAKLSETVKLVYLMSALPD
jgi:ABC-type amino acid transport substrate-binding protein